MPSYNSSAYAWGLVDWECVDGLGPIWFCNTYAQLLIIVDYVESLPNPLCFFHFF